MGELTGLECVFLITLLLIPILFWVFSWDLLYLSLVVGITILVYLLAVCIVKPLLER